MDTKTWQHLLGLESVDVVRGWHNKIFGLELNGRRADEIASAAKQAREYFRNAGNADNTVRPLLTFYGIASLARSTLLLLKPDGGEATLGQGHGLKTVNWSDTLSGDLSPALRSVGGLRIRTTAGLFNDFVKQTENKVCIHIRSSSVDWRIAYPQQNLGIDFTFEELLCRIPDLLKIVQIPDNRKHLASVSKVTLTSAEGFLACVKANEFDVFRDSYAELGYEVTHEENIATIKCTRQLFSAMPPQFMHAYVNKALGVIPHLYIVKPLDNGARFSELSIVYMLSYVLGMLTRYFPTHWVALQSGMRGDGLWPIVHAAQNYVEAVFPELIVEFIHDRLALPAASHTFSIGHAQGRLD